MRKVLAVLGFALLAALTNSALSEDTEDDLSIATRRSTSEKPSRFVGLFAGVYHLKVEHDLHQLRSALPSYATA